MKKYNLYFIIFIVEAIYMSLELIASRLLSPYFGSSNLVWTSVIGIILLSSSIGNFIGGIIADKKGSRNTVRFVLLITGIMVLLIPLIQRIVLYSISNFTSSIKIGAIIATIVLFFIPSMIIGFLSPIMIKLNIKSLETAGKTSGSIYATATLGGIVGNFIAGFWLIPSFGSNEILFVLSLILFLLIFVVGDDNVKK